VPQAASEKSGAVESPQEQVSKGGSPVRPIVWMCQKRLCPKLNKLLIFLGTVPPLRLCENHMILSLGRVISEYAVIQAQSAL
jgi:hypothetical protein